MKNSFFVPANQIRPLNGLVILGMHRSGTSAITGLLNILGFSAGKTLVPANRFNEHGFFEDLPLVHKHDELLSFLDRSWSDVRLLPTEWLDNERVADAREKLAEQFQVEFDLKRQWVVKDPRICRLLPVWKQIFRKLQIQPGFVFTIRHPLEVAASLERRDGITTNHAFLLYSLYLLEAERESRDLPRVVVVYTELLCNWLQTLQKIENDLGVSLPEIDDDMLRQADAFISRDLQHHMVQNPTDESTNLKGKNVVKSVRPICSDLERGRAAFDNEPFNIAMQLYQLLACSNPFTNPKVFDDLWVRLECYLAELKPWLVHGALSTIYWCSDADSGYSESKTIKLPLNYGPRETLRFALPVDGKDIRKMRWDIADCGVWCEIFQAWIEDTKADKVWQWEREMPLFGEISADMKIIRSTDETDRLFILSTGFDPNGQLLIPSNVLVQMQEGCAFVVVISVASPTMAIPIMCDFLKEYKTEIDTIKKLSVKHDVTVNKVDSQIPSLADGLEEVIISLKAALARRDSTIQNQQQQLEQLGLEVTRAEAQLDLLKDFIL